MPSASKLSPTPLAHSGSASRAAPALTGVFATLIEQHRDVLELLREAGAAEDASKRQERWAEARRRLLSHERAENDVVYARLEKEQAARTFVQQHRRQAEELEAAISELQAADRGSDLWIERVRDLLAMLDDHVRDEEHDFFPAAQQLLGERAAMDLDDAFVSAQRDALHGLS